MKKIIHTMIIFIYVGASLPAYGFIDPYTHTKNTRYFSGQEFFVGEHLGKPLVTISLINGVHKPGVYHIPVNTNLAQVLSYAGGSLPSSDMNSISIRRFEGSAKPQKIIEVEFERLVQTSHEMPLLQDNDTIYIEQNNYDRTQKWLTITATIASIILSGVLVYQNSND